MILMGGSGLALYIVCAIIIPNDTDGRSIYQDPSYRGDDDDANGWR